MTAKGVDRNVLRSRPYRIDRGNGDIKKNSRALIEGLKKGFYDFDCRKYLANGIKRSD